MSGKELVLEKKIRTFMQLCPGTKYVSEKFHDLQQWSHYHGSWEGPHLAFSIFGGDEASLFEQKSLPTEKDYLYKVHFINYL